MENVSELIYKDFKQINIIDMDYKEKSKIARITIVFAALISLYYYMTMTKWFIKMLILLSSFALLFSLRGLQITKFISIIVNWQKGMIT